MARQVDKRGSSKPRHDQTPGSASLEALWSAALSQFTTLIQLVIEHPLIERTEPHFSIIDQIIPALEQVIETYTQVYENNSKSNEAQPRKQSVKTEEVKSCYYSHMGQLENIQKLLDAAHELMKVEPGLDRDVIEHVRRARVKMRFAISAKAAVNNGKADDATVPLIAPKLYKDRPDRKENPIDFIKRVYGDYLGKGLSRPDIATLDRRLYDSMNVYVSSHGGDFPDIGLPSRDEVVQRRLQENAGKTVKPPPRTKRVDELSPAEREQMRLYENVRRRKDRAP